MKIKWKRNKDGSLTWGPWRLVPNKPGGGYDYVNVHLNEAEHAGFLNRIGDQSPALDRAKSYVRRISAKIVRAAQGGK